MGCCSDTIARLIIVKVNIFFLMIGLALMAVGFVIIFGDDVLDGYISDAKKDLSDAMVNLGGSGEQVDSFYFTEMLTKVAMGLMLFGLFLVIICMFGCCGSCYKLRALLKAYVAVLLVLLFIQIILAIVIYAAPDQVQSVTKRGLKSNIEEEFYGIEGENFASLAWSITMYKVGCCGVDDYGDFTNARNWNKTRYGTPAMQAPIAACKTLPPSSSASDLDCAINPTTDNSYYNKGCYDKIWDMTIGNATLVGPICGCILVFQFVLIVCGIMLIKSKKDKVHPKRKTRG